MDRADSVSAADLRRAIDVREGLRAVLLQNNGLPLDEERVSGSTARWAARRCGSASSPAATPSSWRAARASTARSRRLMAMVAAGVESGRWERLKACPREECEWAFYDQLEELVRPLVLDGVLREHREGAGVPRAASAAQR